MAGKYKQYLFSVIAIVFIVSGLNVAISDTTVYAQACTPEQLEQGMATKTDDSTDPPTATCEDGAGQAGNQEQTTAAEETTCAIEKIGWILCPIIEQSGKIGDQAFGFLAKTFLETEPELISSTPGVGTRMAWEMARNLANIMFIIAFLIIIYSQVTGAGISNYGIKRMLPRLIFAALAVNVSYFICQAMVDITNIMGYEIQRFLTDAAKSVTSSTAMPISGEQSFMSGGTLTNIALGVLAFGAIVYFLMPVLGAVIGLVLITCLSIVVILLLRKAFIVLLIVVSPIAFVLYLLPNTEKYFQKWLSMFWKLLLVFPVVGMLMGAGQLASSVVLAAGVSSNQVYTDSGDKCITLPTHSGSAEASTGTCTAGAVPFLLGLTAAGIAVIPLLAVYSVLQGALSAAGAIGGKIGGTVSNWNNGRKGNLQKRRQELGDYRSNKREIAAMTGTGVVGKMNFPGRFSARRKGKYAATREDAGAAQEAYTRAARQGQTGTEKDAQEMLDNRKKAYIEKINAENIATERNDVKRNTNADNTRQAQELIDNKQFDSPRLAALLEELNESEHASFMHLASQLHQSDRNGRPIHSLATDTAAKSMGSSGIYAGADIAAMSRGEALTGGLASAAVRNAAQGGLTAASIVGAKSNALSALSGAVATHANAQEASDAITKANNSLNTMSDSLRDNLAQSKSDTIIGMHRNPGP